MITSVHAKMRLLTYIYIGGDEKVRLNIDLKVILLLYNIDILTVYSIYLLQGSDVFEALFIFSKLITLSMKRFR
jgi:hypothetical protein